MLIFTFQFVFGGANLKRGARFAPEADNTNVPKLYSNLGLLAEGREITITNERYGTSAHEHFASSMGGGGGRPDANTAEGVAEATGRMLRDRSPISACRRLALELDVVRVRLVRCPRACGIGGRGHRA